MSKDPKELLSYDGLDNLKQKLFIEKAINNDAQTEKGSNWNNSTDKKGGTDAQIKQTPSKKIKLKHHFKTEAPITPERIDKTRIRTSPNRQTPPLKEKNFNVPNTNVYKHKANLTDFFPINEVEPKNVNYFKTLYSELYPSPKKRSLPFSSIHHKDSIHMRQVSRSQERSLSKSKKKIHFTVFESKEKSKENKSPAKKQTLKQQRPNFIVPYRNYSSIKINLFQDKNPTSKSKEKRSTSKYSLKSSSKDHRSTSLQKKEGFSRRLIKNPIDQQNEDKINQTLEKLQKYRFVGQYIEKWQILEKIQGYIKSNEPECKWPLLIVDQIFKRIRQDNKFQSLVSK